VTTRKVAFVLVSSDHGSLIVNRLDYRMVDETRGFGVGWQILEASAFDPQEVGAALAILRLRRQHYGDGVVAIDCGANIGVHTIEWARRMTGWGSVIAVEAQERIFYALAGNIALNNCFNARAIFAAVASENGVMRIPTPDYLRPASFGSLELKQREGTEFIGQAIDYSEQGATEIRAMTLDSLALSRVDLIKIDVEGMELEVLAGAHDLIQRHRPVLIVESIKIDQNKLRAWFDEFDYTTFSIGINVLAVHQGDKTLGHIKAA
jgi:FkbM family methyltransferase